MSAPLDLDAIQARVGAPFDTEGLKGDIAAGKFAVVNGWLAFDTDECQCGGGGSDMQYAHMPACNYVPVAQIEQLLTPDPDTLALLAEVTRLRAELDSAELLMREANRAAVQAMIERDEAIDAVSYESCPLAIHGKRQATPNGKCPWCEWETLERENISLKAERDALAAVIEAGQRRVKAMLEAVKAEVFRGLAAYFDQSTGTNWPDSTLTQMMNEEADKLILTTTESETNNEG